MKSFSPHSSGSSLVLTLALSCLAACHSQSSSNAPPTADGGSVDAAPTTDAAETYLVLVLYSEMAIRNGDVDIDATDSKTWRPAQSFGEA